MGRFASELVRCTADLTFAGGYARTAKPAELIYCDFQKFLREARPDVVLDLTTYPKTVEVTRAAIEQDVAAVVGATGWTDADREQLRDLAAQRRGHVMLVPNFSLGAVLMMRFAHEAAPFFPAVEIIERHHEGKRDKPSGTALLTVQRILASADRTDIPIHSVRLPGQLAHHEVIFGRAGETLTIKHDSLSRDSFAAGMLLAIRNVRSMPGLTVGLDALLESNAT
ncbi:MAG: 4-hydroxy-tetrahydrodipicolinate reductase [Candidatus Eremiobacteraeota bacterium]|nr:4-hydroxy-tetrahydrodipicolinate reductase [Candidatus Eremiobacteraeota bacterium]